jgi:hypothetical protein
LPSGSCPSKTVVCQPPDQCHLAGACNPADGTCSNPPTPVGTGCDDGNLCTINDACQANGTCVGVLKNSDDNNACTVDSRGSS